MGKLNIHIDFLGTGTSQGIPVVACNCPVCNSTDKKDKRLRSSIFVNVGGQHIVIDCGPDFRQQMLRIGLKRLDAIVLTHEHADHILGLDDIRAFNWVQKKPIDIYAEKRVVDSIKRIFNYVFTEKKYPGVPKMEIHLIENKPFKIGDVEILPIRGYHDKLPILGYRIGDFAYLTDMKTIKEEEKQKLKGLDVLVVNALRKELHRAHFNLQEALDLIAEVKPKQAYLTHVAHLMGFYNEENKLLPDNVSFAYDGLSLDI